LSEERITLLKRREVEAAFFRTLMRPLLERLSEDELREAAGKALCRAAWEAGRVAAREGDGLEDFKKVVSSWSEGGALEIEVVEDGPDVFRFNVLRCRYADLYGKMGLKEWGTVLSCDRDFAFIEGFSEAIGLTRSETLMEGGSCCDFCYRLKKSR